ncbi:energy transducer TonB [Sphingomonas crocodyli]|uniref:Energy transducer TonB n=1 Tax=Sphingomonas crocodyli TaxID=1979270 RepID=A0A437LZT0_9SPHN|nr:energy transducer TonB [Sphingomonas crocodyli]RVT90939.1 energy transducer TonB [Sphingomonas crocodyli]
MAQGARTMNVPHTLLERAAEREPTPGLDREWEASRRYTDQPVSLAARLCGLGGVALITLGIIVGIFFTWTRFQPPPPPVALSVFDIAQPQPPEVQPDPNPDPVPEQARTPQAAPELLVEPVLPPRAEAPLILPRAVAPQPPAAPPAQPPAPPPASANDAKPAWEDLVLGALNRVKRYPRLAMVRRQQGVPYIRFVVDRDGRVLSSRLERSSGFADLDREATELPRRATPLPKPPSNSSQSTIELVVPVEFFLR